MRRLVDWLMVGVLAVVVAGCETTGGGSGLPCEKCSYGYAQVKKSSERHAFCMVNGKQVDCTKNPAECPGCKK